MEIPKIETRLEVKNEAGEVAELYLYGTIRQAFPGEDENLCISANRVRGKLEGLKGKAVNVHINSPGGSVFESIAICNLLKQHDATVNIYIDALAGSGASVIATAGEKVFMFANSMQMIHNAWTIAAGNAKELRKAADDLDKISEAACQSYKSKFVGNEDELKQLLDAETWLTADECLTFGLCTEIIEPKKTEEPEQNIKQSLFAKYQKNTQNSEGEEKQTSLFCKFKN